ncbi:hypothetical protein BDP55DRAFT_715187 [Colletotrichum godetiae]|uniref:Uncharacterized protein n=1 Tax=Colletotrichum godetiae TaxID=1209918 RepID=A0AAJ0AL93_9PEZI|nr:uncharacterized protein BDP55DRAFT_715187 [Colletotrichum godetiae]KAK1675975.1 hypothetical protein BDP55DRAFT_715187 [Colletotrichum godetiae]
MRKMNTYKPSIFSPRKKDTPPLHHTHSQDHSRFYTAHSHSFLIPITSVFPTTPIQPDLKMHIPTFGQVATIGMAFFAAAALAAPIAEPLDTDIVERSNELAVSSDALTTPVLTSQDVSIDLLDTLTDFLTNQARGEGLAFTAVSALEQRNSKKKCKRTNNKGYCTDSDDDKKDKKKKQCKRNKKGDCSDSDDDKKDKKKKKQCKRNKKGDCSDDEDEKKKGNQKDDKKSDNKYDDKKNDDKKNDDKNDDKKNDDKKNDDNKNGKDNKGGYY